MSEPGDHPLKGRFLIFRRWKPTYGTEYLSYYAIAPGESWGMSIRKITGKEMLPFEIHRITMDSVLTPDNEECTEEEFIEFYGEAIKQITLTVDHALRPIN